MDLEKLKRFIDNLPAKLQKAIDLALRKSAEKIQTDLSTIFKTEGRSHNVEWAPLKDIYLKEKVKKGFSEKKLHRTTTLAQSFTYIVDGYQAIIGTPVKYAIYHEFGTRKMPARPFMKPVVDRFIEKNYAQTIFKATLEEVLNAD